MVLSEAEQTGIWAFLVIGILSLLGWALKRIWDRLQFKVDDHEKRIKVVETTIVTREYFDEKIDGMASDLHDQHHALSGQVAELDRRVFHLASGKKPTRS